MLLGLEPSDKGVIETGKTVVFGFICLVPVGKKEGFCNTVDVGEKKK